MAQFDTVANIVAAAATECGLGAVTASYTSGDATVLQLLRLLTKVGRRLVKRYPWLQNRVEYTFVTSGATVYALPADFQSMENQTGWNRSSTFPMHPASPQQWQCLKALPVTSSISIIFRSEFASTTGAPQLEFLTAPGSGYTVAFEYRSRYWVAVDASHAVTKDAPTLITDVLRIDAEVLTQGLRWAWLRAKGFDSTAAQQDFSDALEDEKGANVGASPILSFSGRRGTDRLLDERNAPGTSYGFDVGGLFP